MSSSPSVVLLPRESVEFLPVSVLVDGEPPDPADVEIAVVSERDRPADDDWSAAFVLEGRTGVIIDGLDPARYRVWVKVINSYPETPVLAAGLLTVT